MRALTLVPAGAAAAALMASAPALAQDLTVYTYSSMTAEWGPGPVIERTFEERCGCDLELVGVDDGGTIISRLRLEGENSPADVILGIDQNLIAVANQAGVAQPHGLELPELDMPVDWTSDTFVPFDWGFHAFVYDTEAVEDPPTSFEEFIYDSDLEFIIQDPRTSTPGLGLLLWIKDLYGEDATAVWETLAPRIVTVTSGWSEAYGLFLEGEAPMVLSYNTSPAYHRIAEDTDRYESATFEEGHYMQIEVAAITANSDNPELAREFLGFVTSPEFADIIPTTNWMYPVRVPTGGLPPQFPAPPEGPALLIDAETIADNREAWIDEWLAALSG
jgi:thiamine transport system substrate-binding protein